MTGRRHTGLANTSPDICPCGTGRFHETCCGPFREGNRPAATAVALMRSRYNVYTLGFKDYLLEIWHPNIRPESIDPEPGLRWTGLTIEYSGTSKAWDEEGMVAFLATREEGNQTGTMREVSSLLWVDDRWLYVNGIPHAAGHHTPKEHEKT